MLTKPTIEELLEKVPTTYELSNLMAKRAKQLEQNPTQDMIDGKKKALTIAAEEIAAGKVVSEKIDK
jgi:DNA-directed RNA polymerase omega subunit